MKQKDMRINSFDVLPNGTAKPSALMRYMQQYAREDCDLFGCTYPFMRGLNTVFVVTKLGFELERPFREGETVQMKTYNNSISGLTFDREFEFYSGGREIGHCSSFWVLVRYDTRALVRPRDFPVDFECCGLEHKKIDIPRSFAAEGALPRCERLVRVSDLDENNHLNNCVYADIAVDSVPDFDGVSEWVKGMKIIFKHEARLGETLAVSAAVSDGKSVVFAHNADSDQPCFEAELLREKY